MLFPNFPHEICLSYGGTPFLCLLCGVPAYVEKCLSCLLHISTGTRDLFSPVFGGLVLK